MKRIVIVLALLASFAPRPTFADSGVIVAIDTAADRYGVSRSTMECLAFKESSLNPSAVNPTSGAAGLFQYVTRDDGTTAMADTPYPDEPFDPMYASLATAWYLSHERLPSRWPETIWGCV